MDLLKHLEFSTPIQDIIMHNSCAKHSYAMHNEYTSNFLFVGHLDLQRNTDV